MNRFAAHISKTLAVLVILLLPIQQSLAVTCCCRAVQNDAVRLAASPRADRGSDDSSSCCSSTCDSEHSCCGQEATDAVSNRCQCPEGSCDQTVPNAFDPAAINSSVDVDLFAAATLTIVTTTRNKTAQASPANTVSRFSCSVSDRCVLLCRYQL